MKECTSKNGFYSDNNSLTLFSVLLPKLNSNLSCVTEISFHVLDLNLQQQDSNPWYLLLSVTGRNCSWYLVHKCYWYFGPTTNKTANWDLNKSSLVHNSAHNLTLLTIWVHISLSYFLGENGTIHRKTMAFSHYTIILLVTRWSLRLDPCDSSYYSSLSFLLILYSL